MASEESLVTLKILMIGPSGAGKSACSYLLIEAILMAPDDFSKLLTLIPFCSTYQIL
jgi:hypothetical protein